MKNWLPLSKEQSEEVRELIIIHWTGFPIYVPTVRFPFRRRDGISASRYPFPKAL